MTSLFVAESFSFSFRASLFSFFSFFSLSFSFLDSVLSFSVLIAILKTEGYEVGTPKMQHLVTRNHISTTSELNHIVRQLLTKGI